MKPIPMNFAGVVLLLYGVENLFWLAGVSAIYATSRMNRVKEHGGKQKRGTAGMVAISLTGPVFFAALAFFAAPSHRLPNNIIGPEVKFILFCVLYSGYCALIYRWIIAGKADKRISRVILCVVAALPVVLTAAFYSRVEYLTARHRTEFIGVPMPADWGSGIRYDGFKVLGYEGEKASAYARTCMHEWNSETISCEERLVYYVKDEDGWHVWRDSASLADGDKLILLVPPL